ncbi:Glycosyltransferase, GT2 family [Belliella pelovolcani]|uniref:Glycosyltransferase, GT2 family n=2 Tax=Belliella pelovolcani TaxID=529505 RepID=A0A1N7KW31_9BACT|nr:Glycosyltransferase, GT2 family [Belliella pelovolcani]
MQNKLFAGFIITFNRPSILKATIQKVFNQTFPPEKLWIIDNSDGKETEEMIETLDQYPIVYYYLGYNAGPAYSAKFGLELAYQEGYEWVFWGDDNDPPLYGEVFEKLFNLIQIEDNVGAVGAVGQYFEKSTGKIKRVPTELLERKKNIDVDFIAGGYCFIINKSVLEKNIFPNQDLFFGFEELDYCLRIKRGGFRLVVNPEVFYEYRKRSNRLVVNNIDYVKKINLNREYYSLRNLLMISDHFGFFKMKILLYFKWSIKSVYGFKYGWSYGKKNFKIIWLAFLHFWKGIKGKTIDL